VFITAVPIIKLFTWGEGGSGKLFTWGEGGSGGHVLRETTRAKACVD
jgi:hypothetical protein